MDQKQHQEIPKVRKLSPEVSKMEPKDAKSEPTGAKRSPKGSPREPKGSQKGAKGSQKGAKGEPKGDQDASKNRPSDKVAKMMKKGGAPICALGAIMGAQIDQIVGSAEVSGGFLIQPD